MNLESAPKHDFDTPPETELRAKLLLLYTGGTIGMKGSEKGYKPAAGYLATVLNALPQFHDPSMPEGVTPVSSYGKRTEYVVKEYNPLLDSSNMSPSDWAMIADDIQTHYDNYDAFVVLHGTDTMAYTTSALSFMLKNLGKSVVVTGAQIPLSQPRNDGISNLLGAMIVASHFEIPEVCLYFNNKLYRGNRCTKFDASDMDAFRSFNYPELVSAGVEFNVSWERMLPPPRGELIVDTRFDDNVAVFSLFPGCPTSMLRNILAPPLKGLVLCTFGAGNAPDSSEEFLATLREASDRGVVIINATQCKRGSVLMKYATGVALWDAGVVSGGDMTVEAALTKLGCLLGQGHPVEKVRKLMASSLRGELTVKVDARFSFKDSHFIHSVFRALNDGVGLNEGNPATSMLARGAEVHPFSELKRPADGIEVDLETLDIDSDFEEEEEEMKELEKGSPTEKKPHHHSFLNKRSTLKRADSMRSATKAMSVIRKTMNPILMCSACGMGDLLQAKEMVSSGASVNDGDYDGRTPLHLAACEGHIHVVRFLLAQGANIDAIDRWGHTPLHDALRHRHGATAAVLMKAGGSLKQAELDSELLKASRAGRYRVVYTLLRHGASCTTYDHDQRTALHLAAQHGKVKIVNLLLKHNVPVNLRDRFGYTPLALAIMHEQQDIIPILREAGGIALSPDQSMVPSSPFGGSGALFKQSTPSSTFYDSHTPSDQYYDRSLGSPNSLRTSSPRIDHAAVADARYPRSISAMESIEKFHDTPPRFPVALPKNPKVAQLLQPSSTPLHIQAPAIPRVNSTGSLSSLSSQVAVAGSRDQHGSPLPVKPDAAHAEPQGDDQQ